MMNRPQPGDYGTFFERYIGLVPEGSLLELLEQQRKDVREALAHWTEDTAGYRYAEGKWSVKEVIGHVADTERVMAYRLLRGARGDRTALPGFDQDLFVANAGFDRISWQELTASVDGVREATLLLLRTLPEDAWARSANVREQDTTVLALACIIYGHMQHHLNVLRERYE